MASKTAAEPSAYVTCEHCGKKFRAITFLHLRNIHGYQSEHPILEYKAQFELRHAMSDESREKISEAKEVFWSERGQHWTSEAVLTEICRLHQAGESLRNRDIPVRLEQAARRLFGSWQTAIEKAGLSYDETAGEWRWSPEKVVATIRALHDRGEPLFAGHVAAHYPSLFTAALNHFPSSWRKALRAAGFDPENHKTPRSGWNRQDAEDWVHTRAREGLSVLARDVPKDLTDFVRKHLGHGWIQFVESLGIPYPGVRKHLHWTRDELLAEIGRWHAEGNAMNYKSVKNTYQALIHQARKFFGGWDAACAAAGVALCPKRRSGRPSASPRLLSTSP
jgi:hypothetical protein